MSLRIKEMEAQIAKTWQRQNKLRDEMRMIEHVSHYNAYDRFRKALVDLSTASTYSKAIKEWHFEMVDTCQRHAETTSKCRCICGKAIVNQFHLVRNKPTKNHKINIIVVGTTCFKHCMDDIESPIHYMKTITKNVHDMKRRNHALNIDYALDSAMALHMISEKAYEFYTNMMDTVVIGGDVYENLMTAKQTKYFYDIRRTIDDAFNSLKRDPSRKLQLILYIKSKMLM